MWSKVGFLFLIMLFLQITMMLWIDHEAKQGRSELVSSVRAGCERNKADRKAGAAFQKAHAKYIKKVTGA